MTGLYLVSRDADYKKSPLERDIEETLRFYNIRLPNPKFIDFTGIGGEPSITREINEEGITIEYRRWFDDDELLKKYKEEKLYNVRNINPLINDLNNPKYFWEVFDINFRHLDLSFIYTENKKKINSFEIEYSEDSKEDFKTNIENLSTKIFGCRLSPYFIKEFADSETSVKDKINKLSNLEKTINNKDSTFNPETYSSENSIHQDFTKTYIRARKNNKNPLNETETLSYLFSSSNMEESSVRNYLHFNTHEFEDIRKYFKGWGRKITNKDLIKGMLDSVFERRRLFIRRGLLESEKTGRKMMKIFLKGEDGLTKEFEEFLSIMDILGPEEKSLYLNKLVAGLLLENLKNT